MARIVTVGITIIFILPLFSFGGAPEKKSDFTEFSKLIHKMALKKVPKQYEERFGWGNTIPVPEKLPLARLRTYLKVDDHLELPHGAWRKVRVTLPDPERDLKIDVRDFKQVDKIYRLAIDAEVNVLCEGEWKQWQKGLLLLDSNAEADATLTTSLVCDVKASLDFAKLLPELKLEPKITDMTIDLKSFNIRRLGGTIESEKLREVGERLMRDVLRDFVKATEPVVKDYANQAIAQSLKENKGAIPAGALLKVLPKEKAEKKD